MLIKLLELQCERQFLQPIVLAKVARALPQREFADFVDLIFREAIEFRASTL